MNDQQKIELKQKLKLKAEAILHQRIEHASAAMKEAQSAANEEGKSSVGDKYETARAMAQMDRDIHAKQLESAQKDLAFMQHVDVSLFHKTVDVGSFVVTNEGRYFFLTGIGPVDVDGEKIYFLSISSPIGKGFNGKIAGNSFFINGREIKISEVF